MDVGLLVASPQLRDPHFSRAVVLLIQHDTEGALGLIVNRPSSIRLSDVLEHVPMDDNPPAMWGGPVERARGFVVFRGEAPEGWQVSDDVAVTGSREHLMELACGAEPFFLCLGYAGWGPGQLDAEFASGSWIHVDLSPEILFETPAEERYDRALAALGLSADRVWMTPGDA